MLHGACGTVHGACTVHAACCISFSGLRLLVEEADVAALPMHAASIIAVRPDRHFPEGTRN